MIMKIVLLLFIVVLCGCIPNVFDPDVRPDINKDVDIVYTFTGYKEDGKRFIFVSLSKDNKVKRVYTYGQGIVIRDLKWLEEKDKIQFVERHSKRIYHYEITKMLDIESGRIENIFLSDPYNLSKITDITKDKRNLFHLGKKKRYYICQRHKTNEHYDDSIMKYIRIEGKLHGISYGDAGTLIIYDKKEKKFTHFIENTLLNYHWEISSDEKKIVFTSYQDKTIFKKYRIKKHGDEGSEGYHHLSSYEYPPSRSIYLYEIESRQIQYLTEGENPHFWEDGAKLIYNRYDKDRKKIFLREFDLKTGDDGYYKIRGIEEPVEVCTNYDAVREVKCLYYGGPLLHAWCLNELDLKTGNRHKAKCMIDQRDVRVGKNFFKNN